ncbi:hypothetical protein [Alkalihalobacillus sp. CinArs1]|uniref:hypothetical protein n=1 Tax=Alkalihalobacillus sp. CinArs1 TaxID=2995314 RepID=UPI0022DDC007|nr:hypothetical protein [Alkalihalobacillus sp. CinArs1]
MNLENINIDKQNNKVEYLYYGKKKEIHIPNLELIEIYKTNNRIIALIGESDFLSHLQGYNFEGEYLFEVTPPDHFMYSYLTEGANNEMLVVCSSSEGKVDGWYDWHFVIDENTGVLTRGYPAY